MLRQGNDETILDREYSAPAKGSYSDGESHIVVKSEWDIIDSMVVQVIDLVRLPEN